MTVTIERRQVQGDGGARNGAMLFSDDVLFAVLSCLAEEDATETAPAGTWFLEAGLGPCGLLKHTEQLTFETLEDATAWVEREVASD